MRVIREGDLWQLTWLPRVFPVNCYLLEEKDGLTLIDAAMPFSVKGIVQTAASIGKLVTRIVLTHAHNDHVGALDALKNRYPDAQVYISERDSALLAGDSSLRKGEPNTPVKGGVPTNIRTKADILLHDNDTIGSLKAISTPGHTPGSMSFQDQRSGILIAGDAFQTFRRTAVAGTMVPLFPFPGMATWDKSTACNSARKIIEAAPTMLAVGHGNLLKNPKLELEEAIAMAEKSL